MFAALGSQTKPEGEDTLKTVCYGLKILAHKEKMTRAIVQLGLT
jgi:hypothetical protein